MRIPARAFTLVEVLVSLSIVTLIVLSISKLLINAGAWATLMANRTDCTQQARFLLDRMSIDFGQMLWRPDVDCYLKTPAHPQPGNDQITFFSEVPGYSSSATAAGPLSLVGYRINAQGNAERLGKGLPWNGASSGIPVLFLPQTIGATWPTAVTDAADVDYEVAAPNVFRFEYFYWLRSGALSNVPWDISAGHGSADGMQDVAAISVVIAAIDARSRILLSNTQLTTIAAQLTDFTTANAPGTLAIQWQEALMSQSNFPQPAVAGIRIYQRTFAMAER